MDCDAQIHNTSVQKGMSEDEKQQKRLEAEVWLEKLQRFRPDYGYTVTDHQQSFYREHV